MSEANNLKYSPFLIENELLDIFQTDSICNMLTELSDVSRMLIDQ